MKVSVNPQLSKGSLGWMNYLKVQLPELIKVNEPKLDKLYLNVVLSEFDTITDRPFIIRENRKDNGTQELGVVLNFKEFNSLSQKEFNERLNLILEKNLGEISFYDARGEKVKANDSINDDEFWRLIDRANNISSNDVIDQIKTKLRGKSWDSLIGFEVKIREHVKKLNTDFVVDILKSKIGQLSDDSFLYGRLWLLLHGKEAVTKLTLNKPYELSGGVNLSVGERMLSLTADLYPDRLRPSDKADEIININEI